MDAMFARYLGRNSVALENVVAVRGELDVFVGNILKFLGGVQRGLMDVIHAEQVMEGKLLVL